MSDLQEYYLRFPEVKGVTGLSRSTIWRMEANGSFPKRYQLSTNSVGWKSSEISLWLESRAAA